jgi:hypothetical protein
MYVICFLNNTFKFLASFLFFNSLCGGAQSGGARFGELAERFH